MSSPKSDDLLQSATAGDRAKLLRMAAKLEANSGGLDPGELSRKRLKFGRKLARLAEQV